MTRSPGHDAPFHNHAHLPQPSALPWLTVGGMLADLVFETDLLGRFTSFGPGLALGRPAAELLGMELTYLLSRGEAETAGPSLTEFRAIITTICVECVAWHGKVSLETLEGGHRLYRLALAPRFAGRNVTGTYGLLLDLEAADPAHPGRDDREPDEITQRLAAMLDVETGLWGSSIFTEELSRRFDRLDIEGRPGTMLYLGFSSASAELRTPVAMRLAEELRDITRPTDLLGRIDPAIIGLWCDNMDHLTAGERAARFCATLPALLPGHTALSVGVAPRWPGSGEDGGMIMEHALAALRLADLSCITQAESRSSAWKVWQGD